MIPKTLSEQATSPPISTVEAQDRFHTDQVVTVAGGHFVHDSFTAFLAPLLPLLQDKLGIGYASAGGLAIFSQLPSLLTPFIGYLADRISLRYFVILAPAVTATLMGLMGLAPSYLALSLLLLAVGVSVAAFHAPAPAMIARVSGQTRGPGDEHLHGKRRIRPHRGSRDGGGRSYLVGSGRNLALGRGRLDHFCDSVLASALGCCAPSDR